MPVSARFGAFPGSNCPELLCLVALVPEVCLTAQTNRRPSVHRSTGGDSLTEPRGVSILPQINRWAPHSALAHPERLFDFMSLALSVKTTCWKFRECERGRGQRVKHRTSNHYQSSATTNPQCLHGYFVFTQVFIQRPSRHSWASRSSGNTINLAISPNC